LHSCSNFEIADSGKIWIGWDPRVWDCTVITKSVQQITLSVINKGGLQGYLTIIYGENLQRQREALWKELNNVAAHVGDTPWLVFGDFNTARYKSEKVGGKH